MNQEQQIEKKPKERKKRFESSNKYFTISIYAIVTFCICLFIFKATSNWTATKERFNDVLGMLSPFFIAFLIAYILNPLIRNLDRMFTRLFKGRFTVLHRVLSLLISYVLVLGFIALVLRFIIPQIGSSVMRLVEQAPDLYEDLMVRVNALLQSRPEWNLGSAEQFINENLPNVFSYIENIMTDVVPMVYNIGKSVINWVINLILAFIISCYLMWDKSKLLYAIKRILFAFVHENTAKKILEITRKSNEIFSGFIIGKAIDSLIIGILCFILMCILKLEYGVLISVIVGVTNMIPYFGPFIGAIPGALILLIISPQQALVFVIMIFLLQQFDGNILGPAILGESTGMSPLWIIFAITVGGYLFGVWGMFLGVPVIAVIAYLFKLLVDFLLNRRHLSGEAETILEQPAELAEKETKPSIHERIKSLGKRKVKKEKK